MGNGLRKYRGEGVQLDIVTFELIVLQKSYKTKIEIKVLN